IVFEWPIDRTGCEIAGDEGNCIGAGELTKNADANEVGVDAVIVDPVLDFLLVRPSNFAGVYLKLSPAVGEAPASKALAEAPGVPRRVAEHEPEDFRVHVRQRALGRLPDNVGDRR